MKSKRRYIVITIILVSVIIHSIMLIVAITRGNNVVELIDRNDWEGLNTLFHTDPSYVDSRYSILGDTVLHYAVEQNSLTAVDLILEHGANPNTHGYSKRAPLHLAAINGKTNIAQKLIEYGADMEISGYRHEDKPIHLAAHYNQIQMVEYLLNSGANINSRNMQQVTPLMVAVENKKADLVRLLIKRGAKINLIDQNKKTAVDYARISGDKEIVNILTAFDPNGT